MLDQHDAYADLAAIRTPTGRPLYQTAKRRAQQGECPRTARRFAPRVSLAVLNDWTLSEGARGLLMLCLSLRRRTDRVTEPTSTSALATQRGRTPSAIGKQLRALEDAGYLARVLRKRGTYSLLLSEKAVLWANRLSAADIEKSKGTPNQRPNACSRENSTAFKASKESPTSAPTPPPPQPAARPMTLDAIAQMARVQRQWVAQRVKDAERREAKRQLERRFRR